MKTTIAIIAIVSAMFGAFLANVSLSSAATVDELKRNIEQKNNEIKKIQEELRKYNEELSKTAKASQTLQNKIKMLNASITGLRKQIALTEAQIQQKKFEIREYDLSIKAKEADIAVRRQSLAELIRGFSEAAQSSVLEILLQHAALSDFFSRLEQTKNAERGLMEHLAELREVKKNLEDDRKVAETKRRQLALFQETLADKRHLTEVERREQQSLLTETKNQEKRYQELLSDAEKRAEEIQREIDELEAELRMRVDASSLPPRREGFLKWPTEGVLSQGYGRTLFSRYSGYYTFHNGVDIAASPGTEITAAYGGTVIAVGNSDRYCPRGAYGKFIVIDHHNNLMTLYAHLSLQKVGVGEAVERGQLIGYMGSSGRSTGPHLHFTVYDARTFELRQSRVCGILPYGGSVNPLGYL